LADFWKGNFWMLTLGELERVINSGSLDCAIQEFHFKTDSQNQLLFFVKPEVFLLPRSADSVSVCALMLQKMSQFGADTAGAYMISGAALERYGIMDTHYGFINRMSREASVLLDDEERHRIYKQFPGEGPPILGGHEVLAHRPELTASALDQIWSTKKSIKLRSGLYVQEFEIRGEQLIVVNGFHPLQLEHFTGTGRRVLLILMNSDMPWKLLRSRMLGDTFPERAHPGSIRGALHVAARDYGFTSVTIANNFAHVSAGPFEAAFECNNFLSRIDPSFSISSLRLASHFIDVYLSPDELAEAIKNPATEIAGISPATPLFEITEECDSIAAVAMYRQFYLRR